GLRGVEPKSLTPADAARIASLEAEIGGHYVLRPGETLHDLEARVLARQDGETDAAYKKRLASLQTEVTDAAQRLRRPDLKSNYERLMRSLKRPLETLRREIAE